jgi:hypothetical protein
VVSGELEEKRSEPGPRINWLLWTGLLLPPIAWSVAMEAVYLTDVYTCAGSPVRWSHVSSAVGLIFCIVGGIIAWTQIPRQKELDRGSVPISRSFFMAALGCALAVVFGLLIVAQWLPVIYGVPCSK